jgi:DNA-binding transcriptional LysR family regulator
MRSIGDLPVFCLVAEAQSFSGAARRSGLTTAAVSKAIARLERDLSVRLFTRTTRKVVLTAEGARLHAAARDMLGRLAEAEADLSGHSGSISGTVRLAAPVLLGQTVLPPVIAAFRSAHPACSIDLRLSDWQHDLVAEGIDLALRFGDLADSRIVARKLAETRFATVAAPDYLKRAGVPASPAQLTGHSRITYVVQRTGQSFAWRFADGTALPDGQITVGDGGANAALALAGVGIAQDVDTALAPLLIEGRLTEILTDSRAPGPTLWLVQPAGRFVPSRVQRLAAALVAAFARATQGGR